MINDLDLFKPDFAFDLIDLSNSADIYTIMRDNGIVRAYAYTMVFRPKPFLYDFLKVGMSAPKLEERREYQVGERVVRQLAWLPGWKHEPPYSDNGSAFWNTINRQLIQEKKILPSSFNKNNLSVGIWDVSKRAKNNDIVSSDEELTLAQWAEGELTSQYKKKFGRLPLLNIIDPSKSKVYAGAVIRKSTLKQFIEFV
jgi:hypothetical protein